MPSTGSKAIFATRLFAAALAFATISLIGLGPAQSQEYRFPEKPFGYGTPAEPCVVCHSIEKNGTPRYAPSLYGIVGSEKAAGAEGFGYSAALFNKDGTWTEEELSKYLADPIGYAPGTKKTIKITDPQQREKIITYLKKLANP